MTGTAHPIPVPDFSDPHFFETVQGLRDFHTTPGTSYIIALAALLRGLDVTFYRTQAASGKVIPGWKKETKRPGLYSISEPDKRAFKFFGSTSDKLRSRAFARASKDKSGMKALLHHAGVSAPFGGAAKAGKVEILNKFAQAGVKSVVVKPVAGSLSAGVLAGVSLEHAYAHIMTNSPRVFMVEQYLTGTEMRVFTVGDDVVAAALRIPVHVVGDGMSTLEKCIADKIALQKANPFSSVRMQSEDALKAFATGAGHGLTDVPDAGSKIWLEPRSIGSYEDLVDVTDDLSDDVRDVALKAARAMGAKMSGLDIIQTASGEPFVLELNAKPGIMRHSFPINGPANLTVPEAILKYHFPRLEDVARPVQRFDYLQMMEDFQSKPDQDVFDTRDYVEFA